MTFRDDIWRQLKGMTVDELVKALLKDGFVLDAAVRTERIYRHDDGRKVSVHYHSDSNTYGPGLLKALLENVAWTEKDLRRLKLIK